MNLVNERSCKAHDVVRGLFPDLQAQHIDWVGSSYISGVTDTDVDMLVYSGDIKPLCLVDWDNGGSEPPGEPDVWTSYKKVVDGVEINIILTNSVGYFRDWQCSAEVCKFLELMGVHLTKGQVHGVHQIIMDGGTATEEYAVRGY